MKKKLTNYWMKFSCDNHCTLCGNSGIIDTTGVKTSAGVLVGRKNYCICPNGQALRKQKAESTRRHGANNRNTNHRRNSMKLSPDHHTITAVVVEYKAGNGRSTLGQAAIGELPQYLIDAIHRFNARPLGELLSTDTSGEIE